MAFLDNSGDIILDAVLTDLGRKRLAEGNFRITQFAFGDDEVDYSLYNKNHPSGSAYYDLEILQTPVFEAFTRTNANINYGLANYNGNVELLYLPTLVLNEKDGPLGAKRRDNVIYYAVNDTTRTNLSISGVGSTIRLAEPEDRRLVIESGLQSSSLGSDAGNQTEYIVNQGLLDPNIIISLDGRLFSGVSLMDSGASAVEGATGYEFFLPLTGDALVTDGTVSEIDNYRSVINPAVKSQIYPSTAEGRVDTAVSAINGPRGIISAFKPRVIDSLKTTDTRDAKYALYGKVSQNLFSDGRLYDYIDTTIYVRGQTTGASTQIVVRIIRTS